MKNYLGQDRIKDEEFFISQEEVENILKMSDIFPSPYGGKGKSIDKVIYEDISSDDDSECELIISAVCYNSEWYVVPSDQNEYLQFELNHSSFEG